MEKSCVIYVIIDIVMINKLVVEILDDVMEIQKHYFTN